ncbi:mitochondrial 54S ribosomal protein img2 [Coemansia sp. RSA 1804]|nr:mitochondrial 54S ribosomal protein img2 [Coemansia sp. RSA 1804]
MLRHLLSRCVIPRTAGYRITPRAFESTLAAESTDAQNNNAAAAAATAQNTVMYPYFVNRTRFQSLPVYLDIKNGKTRKLTLVRRIEGDIHAIHKELSSHLKDATVQIKSISNQLVIKGDRSKEVREWLTKKGF